MSVVSSSSSPAPSILPTRTSSSTIAPRRKWSAACWMTDYKKTFGIGFGMHVDLRWSWASSVRYRRGLRRSYAAISRAGRRNFEIGGEGPFLEVQEQMSREPG